MSKAILILDMPKSCKDCDLVVNGITDLHDGYLTCMCLESEQYKCDVTKYRSCRPEGCPLKECPQKKIHSCIDNEFQRGAKTGYNACIDAILKGSEEDE